MDHAQITIWRGRPSTVVFRRLDKRRHESIARRGGTSFMIGRWPQYQETGDEHVKRGYQDRQDGESDVRAFLPRLGDKAKEAERSCIAQGGAPGTAHEIVRLPEEPPVQVAVEKSE